MKTTCSIRKMQESDIKDLSRGFISQGWPSREEILTRYFKEQESGEREVLIAENLGPYTINLTSMIGFGGTVNENGTALLVDPILMVFSWVY